jgi:hypothetical protein
MRAKAKPNKFRYTGEDEYDYGEKVTPKHEGPKRGRPSTKRDVDPEMRRDMSNPYEKAPYKKRRSHLEPKDESVKDEHNRSSAKWES